MNYPRLIKSVAVASLLLPSPLFAQELGSVLSGLSQAVSGAASGETGTVSGRILQMLAIGTLLSLAPGILVVMTSFTRFIIVFSMLRSALGLNQSPPNMVLVALSLFMTIFVMQPVMDKSWQNGIEPLLSNNITEEQAIYEASFPIKEFMYSNTRPKDLDLFLNSSDSRPDELSVDTVGWRELIPAFIISEIRRAFTIGFMIYLPFLAIDMIIASVLMSAGMMMLPPVMISIPFKVIFFVLIDGWYLLVGSLIQSYQVAL